MKKFISLFLSLIFALHTFALTRYLVAGGTGNWNSTTNWSTASGGGSGASFPVAGDDVIIDAGSANANITVNVASACLSVTVSSGHTGTLTMTNTLTLSGSITLGSAMTVAGAGNLLINGSGTYTSNGVVWSGGFQPNAPATITFADSWTINGQMSHSGTGGAQTWNGNTLNVKGNWAQTGGRTVAGTTTINFNGTTGTQTLAVTGTISNPVIINSSNTISVGNWNQAGGSFTYTAASSISFTGVVTFSASLTINCPGITFNNVSFSGTSQTYTLSADLDVNGTLTLATATNPVLNGNTIKVGGSLSHTVASVLTGTTLFLIDGTGTWSSTSAGCIIRNDMTINTAGTLTIGLIAAYNTGTLTYVSGSIAGTGVLTIGASTTLNTAGAVWPNINLTGNETITLNSILTATILNITTVSVIFDGTSGFTVGTFTITTGNQTLKTGLTYTVTNNFTCVGLASNSGILQSSTAVDAIFILSQGANQDVGFCDATRINSAAGQTIWTYKGVLSNTTNWSVLPTQPGTITTSN